MKQPHAALRLLGAAFALALPLAGCSLLADRADPDPTPVDFTPLHGYYLGHKWGTFVFRTQTEFDSLTYPLSSSLANVRPVSLADSIVIAVGYGEKPANFEGGDVREITCDGQEVTVHLNPTWQPNPVAMADVGYDQFVVVAKADLPANATFVFEGDVPPQGP